MQNPFIVTDVFGAVRARFNTADNALTYARNQAENDPGKSLYVAKVEPIFIVEGTRQIDVKVTIL